MNRRAFLKGLAALSGAAAAQPLLALQPVRRSGPSRFRTSLVAYSFRERLLAKDPTRRITLFDVIDFAADQGFDGIELTGYYFEVPTTTDYLRRLRRHLYLRGLAVSGTAVGDELLQADEAALREQMGRIREGVDRAVVLGAPYVRMFAGHARNLGIPGARQRCVAAIEECAAYAGERGIFLGMENDGGLSPDQYLSIALAVQNPWFGLNLDLGNFHTPTVYADLARCAPYAINVHYKKEIVIDDRPAVKPDIPRLLRMLRDVRYQGYLAFEYEGDGDPYREIPPWKAELAQYL